MEKIKIIKGKYQMTTEEKNFVSLAEKINEIVEWINNHSHEYFEVKK